MDTRQQTVHDFRPICAKSNLLLRVRNSTLTQWGWSGVMDKKAQMTLYSDKIYQFDKINFTFNNKTSIKKVTFIRKVKIYNPLTYSCSCSFESGGRKLADARCEFAQLSFEKHDIYPECKIVLLDLKLFC